ncbi:hypothetical protein L484_023385 [Morus notabilis]|uniref:Uncharacterized protein n=1 Tax=Morus notabilis TaxID=981085 RepID=W9SU82_9ROSA|nr:hypothetical protein L484_023385 [Morus notabilis]
MFKIFLRSYELRLVRCTLPPSPSPPPPSDDAHNQHPIHSLITDHLASIEAGCYLEVLASPAASRLAFGLDSMQSPLDDSTVFAGRVYSKFLG